MNLTLEDILESKELGYTHVVNFVNSHGVPFRKRFTSEERMNAFIAEAEAVGTVVKEIRSI